MHDFDLGLPRRAAGLTHVLDKGLGPRGWEDVLDVAGELIDVVKLGWGTAYVTASLRRKLDVLKEKPVVLGGTFFEVVYLRDKLEEYKVWLADLGLTHVEISDGTVDIPRERKLELVADFARDFTVLSEVGSKNASVEYSAAEWKGWLQEELDAGAWKVITEARERGTAGIFDSGGGVRAELIGEIADAVGTENVIFEAPSKDAQAWFVKQFGAEVNLGNIPPEEVIPLETLRLGLRGDTLKELLLEDPATA
ncbi:MAG TPA: phosphosulfolactate synthase [Gaiellaceae bacterium]|nr:phosphosulfolactate synthase [Gaiellaceae bacterium]